MVSYKPLFRYCLEHDISKADCRRMCGISPNTRKLHKTQKALYYIYIFVEKIKHILRTASFVIEKRQFF